MHRNRSNQKIERITNGKTTKSRSSSLSLTKMAFVITLARMQSGARAFSMLAPMSKHLNNNGKMALTRAVNRSYSASMFSSSNRMVAFRGTDYQFRSSRYFSSSKAASSIEDDLDSALDEILMDVGLDIDDNEEDVLIKAIDEEETDEEEQEEETNEIPIDYQNPEFRSILNPYWIEQGMPPSIIQSLSEKGISQFTPVQAESFVPALKGRDIIGRSRTGTGKTLAFGIPAAIRLDQISQNLNLLDRNGRRLKGRSPSMLVLCPTRELARQVQEEIANVCKPMRLYVDCFHGGTSYDPQARSLANGIDILVGTPGRIMDHLSRNNLSLSKCHTVVLDEADEMLNMGFAEDVEEILEGVGCDNEKKTQCMLFSATNPSWVKQIASKYQDESVLMIDSTTADTGARTAKTVRHVAIQVPPGMDSKKAILEDIIAVELSKDFSLEDSDETDELARHNPIAAAALARQSKSQGAMQQKIFGKTIVFTETKRDADDLVNGSVFKSLTAQALHGDIGQKQRDSIMAAFREGSFNVLVATDVAARGIDINDVDVVVQFGPPRDTDTYVHRSGRTGRAGKKGISVLLFATNQARDIVRIERSLGHGFKFDIIGPPTIEAALNAAAKTSAVASGLIPDETAQYFQSAASDLLQEEGSDPVQIVAKCLAAISRRSTSVKSRSLLTGELGMVTVQMANDSGQAVNYGNVMFTVSKLSRMSQRDGNFKFESDVGKINVDSDAGTAYFDMSESDANNLVEFSKDVDAGGSVFTVLKEMEISRGNDFGREPMRRGGGGGRGGGRYNNSRSGGFQKGYRDYGRNDNRGGGGGRSSYGGGGRERGGGGRSSYGGGGGGRSSYGGGGRERGGRGNFRDNRGGPDRRYSGNSNRGGGSSGDNFGEFLGGGGKEW